MFKKLLVITLGLAFLGGLAVAEADGKKGKKLVFLIDTHLFADFDQTDPAQSLRGGFQFYVSGDICKEKSLLDPLTGESSSCTPIGVFHCWGWDTGRGPDGPVLVSQEYDLWGHGKIQVQGVEDEGRRAVTGGTRKFENVSGEATGFDLSEFPDTGRFIATFKLNGAKHKRNH